MSATATSPALAETVVERLRPLDPAAAEEWQLELGAVAGGGRSRLCANGDPVELAFVWPSSDVRITCDPLPGATAVGRLRRALDLCERDLPEGLRAHGRRLAAAIGPSDSWGGWVGSRVRAGRIVRKLYVELPGTVGWRWWPPARPMLEPALPGKPLRPVMAGFGGASGGVELYFRTSALDPRELAAVMSAAGIRGARRTLETEVAFIGGRAVNGRLPGSDQGVSIAFDGDGAARSVTWYTHADMLLGPPASVREAFLRAGEARGWSMEAYAALSRPDARGRVPWHGLAGVTLTADGDVACSLTCSLTPSDW